MSGHPPHPAQAIDAPADPAGAVDRAPPAGLAIGQRLPDFAQCTLDGRWLLFYEFANGRPVVLATLGGDPDEAKYSALAAALRALAAADGLQVVLLAAAGLPDPGSDADFAAVLDEGATVRGICFGEGDGPQVQLAILDPNLRLLSRARIPRGELADGRADEAVRRAVAPALSAWHAEATELGGRAPVLVVPRVISPALCRALIEGFPRWQPKPSPMPSAQADGLQVDATRKSRLDALIGDPALESAVVNAVGVTLLAEIAKAFDYEATRFERLKLVCYRAGDGGHFGMHRDNTAPQTAHRRFALTLNLNTGDYQGGELGFPEYGASRGYAPPAGGAIVFACANAHCVRPVTRGERYALVSFLWRDGE